MNYNEINVFGGPDPDVPEDNNEEIEDNFEELDCPIVGLLENMYFEPHPYGMTISTAGTKKLLESIGYKIVTKDSQEYALKEGEKLSRNKDKRQSQSILEVYRQVTEKLAIDKFLKDWNDVYGTTGNSTEA